jgi:hypothetical protein
MEKRLKLFGMLTVGLSLCLLSCDKQEEVKPLSKNVTNSPKLSPHVTEGDGGNWVLK